MSDVSNLVKKTAFNSKISEIENKVSDDDHDKYITTAEFNKLTAENFTARLVQGNLATSLTIFNKKINSNKTKHLLVENELKN